MPYRIDVTGPPIDVLDRLTGVDILDAEEAGGVFSAIVADSTRSADITCLLAGYPVTVSEACGSDDGSVWRLRALPFTVGRWTFLPPDDRSGRSGLRLSEGGAFGTGQHPTTALCLEMLDGLLEEQPPGGMLDVGTGSGILALAALQAGVRCVVGLDLDFESLEQARRSARANGLSARLLLVQGEPSALGGSWPLVIANILPAVLVDIAPELSKRVARYGRLVLSGIPDSLVAQVAHAYVRSGMRQAWGESKGGWSAVVFTPSW